MGHGVPTLVPTTKVVLFVMFGLEILKKFLKLSTGHIGLTSPFFSQYASCDW